LAVSNAGHDERVAPGTTIVSGWGLSGPGASGLGVAFRAWPGLTRLSGRRAAAVRCVLRVDRAAYRSSGADDLAPAPAPAPAPGPAEAPGVPGLVRRAAVSAGPGRSARRAGGLS
jgi:hypothetical protein